MAASVETCHKQVNPRMMIPGENLACVAVFSFPSGHKLKRTKASGKKEQRKTKTGEGERKGRKWRLFLLLLSSVPNYFIYLSTFLLLFSLHAFTSLPRSRKGNHCCACPSAEVEDKSSLHTP